MNYRRRNRKINTILIRMKCSWEWYVVLQDISFMRRTNLVRNCVTPRGYILKKQ